MPNESEDKAVTMKKCLYSQLRNKLPIRFLCSVAQSTQSSINPYFCCLYIIGIGREYQETYSRRLGMVTSSTSASRGAYLLSCTREKCGGQFFLLLWRGQLRSLNALWINNRKSIMLLLIYIVIQIQILMRNVLKNKKYANTYILK